MNNKPKYLNQISVVSTFEELIDGHLKDNINARCWHRNLKGNFKEIVSKLKLYDNITEISIDDLLKLNLSKDAEKARETIIQDIQLLTNYGAAPSLNLLKSYERDDEFDFITTDVYSYHVDRSPILTDTFLCTYYGAATDILANNEAEQKIYIPEIREQLKKLYKGSNDGFDDFLKDNFFDLHYQAKTNANPINLGLGNIWRLAVDHPNQEVLPCIHRAPKENIGEYRLLLIC